MTQRVALILPQLISQRRLELKWRLAGARTLATIVTTQYGVKMSRYLTGNLMKELDIMSCQ
ncbi:hypothetical protein L3033_003986 [Providencia stuartii]|uniref:hypothetical protein n=1 Tax=Providencia TaxID=586 RepID=UPI00234A25F2|nr:MULTISPECIES: hypothetical protein [Providencia]MDN0018148.1 hypothetical protein [Providencia stuartii]